MLSSQSYNRRAKWHFEWQIFDIRECCRNLIGDRVEYLREGLLSSQWQPISFVTPQPPTPPATSHRPCDYKIWCQVCLMSINAHLHKSSVALITTLRPTSPINFPRQITNDQYLKQFSDHKHHNIHNSAFWDILLWPDFDGENGTAHLYL